MRQRYVMASALLVMASVSLLVRAEDHDAIMQQLAAKRDEKTLEVLTTSLNLNPGQQATTKAALADQTKKTFDLQKDFSTKLKAIHDDADAQITSGLTDDQKVKYADVKAQIQKQEAQLQSQRLNLGGSSSGGSDDSGGGMSGRHGGGHRGGLGD